MLRGKKARLSTACASPVVAPAHGAAGTGAGGVLPRMRGGIGADEVALPVGRRAVGVVGLQGLPVVDGEIAEYRSKFAIDIAIAHQPIPEVMPDLVPEVTEQGAIRLMQLRAPSL